LGFGLFSKSFVYLAPIKTKKEEEKKRRKKENLPGKKKGF